MNYIVGGVTDVGFGSKAKRENLIMRDVSKSPFKDPTIVQTPAPDHYSPQVSPKSVASGTELFETDYGEKMNPDLKRLSVFKSPVVRDSLASVSLDARQSPGPGTYLQQTQFSPK